MTEAITVAHFLTFAGIAAAVLVVGADAWSR